ncbi:MAG: C10 family peptidase [Bacteroidota bacterium]
MFRIVFICVWIGLLSGAITAECREISREEAETAAVHFMTQKSNSHVRPAVLSHYSHENQGTILFHCFDFREGGFVITTADDRFFPVLAWSDEHSFDFSRMPDNVRDWMKWYEQQILSSIEDPDFDVPQNQLRWEELLSGAIEFTKKKDAGVEPLLTCKWDQGTYYNALCPEDPWGNGTRAPVGCVATAMAQVMYFFRFPQQGSGSYAYTPPYNGGIYGVQSADFGNTQYHWEEMTDECLSENFAIAQISYHCGVAVDMGYTPTSSGSNTLRLMNALPEYFNYSDNIQNLSRSDYANSEDWQGLLIDQLENNIPIIYRSSMDWLGHVYVCDGYQDSTHFHFNWGWSGNFNGYFFIDELVPGGININNGQGGVFNIYPDTTQYLYPPYCGDLQILTANSGSLGDGSGPEPYLPENSCNWLIQPDDSNVTNILLEFTKLDTDENDLISIYAGTSANDPLAGTFSGNILPDAFEIESGAVFITFESGSGAEHQGWHANYLAYQLPFCIENTQVTEHSGTLNDGSDFLDYKNNTDCDWLLQPVPPSHDSVERIKLSFNYFDLASGDTLFLYDGLDHSAPVLATLTGNTLPGEILSSHEAVFIRFTADDAETAYGWSFSYFPVPPVYCSDTAFITEKTGFIEDGSGNKHYTSNSDCYWHIEIPDADFITIEMQEVAMEFYYDYLAVYDGDSQPVAHITGNTIPGPFTIDGNTAVIHFHSDFRDNAQGWKLFYYSSAENIGEAGHCPFIIHPNPVNDFFRLTKIHEDKSRILYQIMNTSGTVLLRGEPDEQQTVDMRNMPAGIYLLKIVSGEDVYIKKIVKH